MVVVVVVVGGDNGFSTDARHEEKVVRKDETSFFDVLVLTGIFFFHGLVHNCN